MKITSVNNENQPEIDEIEKILLTFDKDKALRREKLNKYVPELAKFSKNELERKKVDTEHSVAQASSAANIFFVAPTLMAGILIPEAYRPDSAALIFCAYFFIIGKVNDGRNNRLYALKIALVGK